MLIRFADGRTTFIDFRERAPAKATPTMYVGKDGKATTDSDLGYLASGVPGTPRGLELAQHKYGVKSWAEVVEPARRLAEKGFIVSYDLAHQLRSKSHQARLTQFPESKRVFLRNGHQFEPGELFVQPDLARTLKRLMKKGAADFYEGETARLLVADFRTATDIQNNPAVNTTSFEACGDDLSRLPVKPAAVEVWATLPKLSKEPTKLEGLAVLSPTEIAVANDNDFGLGEGAAPISSAVWILRLTRPLLWEH